VTLARYSGVALATDDRVPLDNPNLDPEYVARTEEW
jgi:hypothetical protein